MYSKWPLKLFQWVKDAAKICKPSKFANSAKRTLWSIHKIKLQGGLDTLPFLQNSVQIVHLKGGMYSRYFMRTMRIARLRPRSKKINIEVPERLISANPGLNFLPSWYLLSPIYCVEKCFVFLVSLPLSRCKGSTAFTSELQSSYIFLDKKPLLKIWLNADYLSRN